MSEINRPSAEQERIEAIRTWAHPAAHEARVVSDYVVEKIDFLLDQLAKAERRATGAEAQASDYHDESVELRAELERGDVMVAFRAGFECGSGDEQPAPEPRDDEWLQPHKVDEHPVDWQSYDPLLEAALSELATAKRELADADLKIQNLLGVVESGNAAAHRRDETIRQLRERVKELRDALEPFAAIGDAVNKFRHEDDSTCEWRIKARDARNAKRVYESITPPAVCQTCGGMKTVPVPDMVRRGYTDDAVPCPACAEEKP